MTQHSPFQSHRFWTALKSTATPQRATVFVSVSLLLSLAIAPMVLAGYKPPRSSRPSGPSDGLLTRTEGSSCEETAKGTLTALAPLGHVGQTIATHPTFAWYVPDNQSYPIELTLYSYASNGKPILLYKSLLQSKKGIMQHSLPKAETSLKVGQTYLWQVALLCDPNSSDRDQIVQSAIEVVAIPTALQSSLAKTPDHLQRANLYAEAGFWYDAFAETLAADSKIAGSKIRSVTIPLLEDLVKVEATVASAEAKQQHDQLQQVLNAERQ